VAWEWCNELFKNFIVEWATSSISTEAVMRYWDAWSAFSDVVASSYALYNKTASAMTDATIALNRSLTESYGGSKDIMAAEKNAIASARIVFEDKFADPESL
jgi:hypothetical protein